MKIDNFKTLEENLFKFEPRTYYKFEAIIRQKDGENLLLSNPNSTSLKFWLIDSNETYEKLKPIMKEFCKRTGARLYVTLDKKSTKKTFINVMKTLMETIGDFMCGTEYTVHKLNKIISSETSKKENNWNAKDSGTKETTKTWMIDVDTNDVFCEHCVRKHTQNNGTYICSLKTPNGWHVVTRKQFCKDMFKDLLETDMLFEAETWFLDNSQKQKADKVEKYLQENIDLKENALGLVYKYDKEGE